MLTVRDPHVLRVSFRLGRRAYNGGIAYIRRREWCATKGVAGDEADSSLLAALARRNDKDFGLMRGTLCRSERIVTGSKVKIPTLSQSARQGWGTLEFGFELPGTELRDGVKPFFGGDRLNRIGV